MMKKRIVFALMLVLALAFCAGAHASAVIQRPDQYLTVMVYRSAAVERMPGTEITSFERDQNDMVGATAVGGITGYEVGTVTLFLEEYDSEKDIYYRSNIHVTVEPLDKNHDYERDQSDNSEEMQAWVQDNGHVFAVGEKYSVKMNCTLGGQPQEVTYKSNRTEVATVDQNGMVTMQGPGTACVSIYGGGKAIHSIYLIVHDGETGAYTSGSYTPADPSARMNVYKEPDEKSQVIATMGRWESDNFYVFSRGEEWSRVSLNGKIGYAKTAELHFKDQKAENETREFSLPCTLYVNAQSLGTLDLLSALKQGSWLGEYATDTPVYATEISGNFAKVTVDGKTGYMNLSFLSSIKPEKPLESQTEALQGKAMQVYVPGGEKLKVWGDKGASVTGNQVGSLKNGEVVLVLGQFGDDAVIVYNGKIAYAQKKYLVTPEEGKESAVSKGVDMYVKADGDVTVYSEANSASAITQKVADGTEAVVYTSSNGWSLVNINGYTGYIQSQFLVSQAGENPAAGTTGNMIVQTGNTGKLYLRAQPKAGAAILGKYPNGTYVTVHAKMGEWGYVTVQGQQGYMMLKFLAAAPHQQPEEEKKEETEAAPDPGIAQIMVVQTGNSGKLYLRAEPKAGAAILDKYPNGTLITVHEKTGEWGRVTAEGKQGYMMLKFLTAAPAQQPEEEKKEDTSKEEGKEPEYVAPKAMVVQTGNTGKLYLRAEPKAGSAILDKYPNGTLLVLYETSGEWGRVLVEGKQGYMMLKFLTAAPVRQPEEEKTEEPMEEAQPPVETPEEEPKEETSAAPEAPRPGMATVTHPKGSFVNLRSGPHTDYKVLAAIEHGTQVEVLQRGEYWSKIRVNGLEGYMVSNYLK